MWLGGKSPVICDSKTLGPANSNFKKQISLPFPPRIISVHVSDYLFKS